jgi:hypothetical protein
MDTKILKIILTFKELIGKIKNQDKFNKLAKNYNRAGSAKYVSF